MSDTSKTGLYERAGIDDLEEFYRTKFVSDEVLDARYFAPLNRFDMRFARTMWIYDNVRAGASVLDLGCGAGMLALLKRKGVVLTGVDLSGECALAARRNGYDATCQAELTKLPFADASFDYVVSLDVLGHVAFEEKDAVLSEIRRVMRPGGVTMHGIECTDHAAQRTYGEMNAEELRRFIEIDGHVGLEEEQEHAERFARFFAHVAWEPRYALCLSSEEFLKQADRYGLPFEQDFLDYLRGLSFKERRAFDMAMGYVFGKISDLHIRLPKSGLYVFLKASDAPLGSFYNEHRDRRTLVTHDARNQADASQANAINLSNDDRHDDTHDDTNDDTHDAPPGVATLTRNANVASGNVANGAEVANVAKVANFANFANVNAREAAQSSVCLDRSMRATFDDGWYEPNVLPPVARWMRERARVRFDAPTLSRLRLDLTTHIPDLSRARPLRLELLLNGASVSRFSLFRYGWLELDIALPATLDAPPDAHDASFELEIRADRTWQPRPGARDDRDDRELSIAVCNIEIG